MTPRGLKTLRLMQGQISGMQAHLGELSVRLRAVEAALDDVGAGAVIAEGLSARQAATISSHLGAEIGAIDVVIAQAAMCAALARVLADD